MKGLVRTRRVERSESHHTRQCRGIMVGLAALGPPYEKHRFAGSMDDRYPAGMKGLVRTRRVIPDAFLAGDD